ncbi:MAG: gfo/Idh/MocA family oxidoreductase [Planctomycetota bacterium]|nr:MAG: gfo/Idh/MocA family oxidoreductase [Planctomycetota bacterium]
MSFNRRSFLGRAALGAAAVSASRVANLQAAEEPASKSPNEKIGFAIIGVGGRGGEHINEFAGRTDVDMMYLCDADEQQGERRCGEVEKKTGRRPKFVKDFREVLNDPKIHAVSTATPNHWHSLVSILAMQAGKDVYVEKPVSHNVWEGRQAAMWSTKLSRICQCGTQSRSSPSLKEAVAFVREGKLGKIQYAIGTCYKPRPSIGKLDKPLQIPAYIDYDLWCGPAEKRELFRPRLSYDWHWDYNTGNGDMGNQGIHQMDIARWFLGEQQLSPKVMSIGERLGYEDAGDTANTQVVYHDYEKAPLIFETRGLPKKDMNYKEGMDNYRGSTVGVIVQCEQGYVVIPSYSNATAFDNDGKELQSWKGGGNHFVNFLDCVRSRKRENLNADILEGHLSSALCHTGTISHRLGQKMTGEQALEAVKDNERYSDSMTRMAEHLKVNGVNIESPSISVGPWLEMDPTTERFKDNDAANLLLTRPYRAGYVVPECQQG